MLKPLRTITLATYFWRKLLSLGRWCAFWLFRFFGFRRHESLGFLLVTIAAVLSTGSRGIPATIRCAGQALRSGGLLTNGSFHLPTLGFLGFSGLASLKRILAPHSIRSLSRLFIELQDSVGDCIQESRILEFLQLFEDSNKLSQPFEFFIMLF